MSADRSHRAAAESRQEILETIRDLTAAGETDDMGGGVPMKRLVDEVDSTRGSIKGHLTTLREEGKVKKVNGRVVTHVRPSYLPVEEVDSEKSESRDRELRADGGTVSNGAHQIPFEYTTAIKIRLSGLSRGSAGNGRARDTVNHLFVKEAFEEGRLSREADTYLCDPNTTPRFPSDEGEHDEPREVTCSSCLGLMERWKGEDDGVAWCMSCGETAEGKDRDPERFAETHTEDDCPAGEPVVEVTSATETERDR